MALVKAQILSHRAKCSWSHHHLSICSSPQEELEAVDVALSTGNMECCLSLHLHIDLYMWKQRNTEI